MIECRKAVCGVDRVFYKKHVMFWGFVIMNNILNLATTHIETMRKGVKKIVKMN